MEQSWLNPDYAINNIVTLFSAILLLLVVVPLIFGALMYAVLTLIARLVDARRPAHIDPDLGEDS
jgi:hypothetical protein